MAKICPNCGNQLKEKATFCGKCGSKWSEEPAKKTPAPAKKTPTPAKKAAAAPANGVRGFVKAHKTVLSAVGGLVLAVVLLLVIINSANSPGAVFNRYLGCLHAQNADEYAAISYEANFSKGQTRESVAELYTARFTSADESYKNGGRVDLLKDTDVRVTKEVTPKQSDIAMQRSDLADDYRNTGRITDIREISFEIKRGEQKTIGTAKMICVTGKWYVGEVTGI